MKRSNTGMSAAPTALVAAATRRSSQPTASRALRSRLPKGAARSLPHVLEGLESAPRALQQAAPRALQQIVPGGRRRKSKLAWLPAPGKRRRKGRNLRRMARNVGTAVSVATFAVDFLSELRKAGQDGTNNRSQGDRKEARVSSSSPTPTRSGSRSQATRPPATKRGAVKRAAVAKQATAKRAPAEEQPAAKRAPAKRQAAVKRAPAKKPAPVKRAPAKEQAAASRAPVKKQAAAERGPAKRQAAASRAPVKKQAAAERAPAKRRAAASRAPAKKQAPGTRATAAKQDGSSAAPRPSGAGRGSAVNGSAPRRQARAGASSTAGRNGG
jgi:hypothetical protein